MGVLLAQSSHFSGPLPHPAILRDYEAAVPNSASKLISMARKEQRHRHEIETRGVREVSKVNNARIALSKTGQAYGFVTAMMALVCGTVAICLNHEAAGAGLLIGSGVTLATLFVTGRKDTGQDPEPAPDLTDSGDDSSPKGNELQG